MAKCPRCKLPNKNLDQCEYCGLVFDEVRKTGSSAGPGRRVVLAVLALFAVGMAAAGFWFHFGRSHPEEATGAAESRPFDAQKTADSELKKTARELSGGPELFKHATEGTSRGSVIAMVVFSVIGIGYLSYGKKSRQLLMVVCGIALMGYSYFVNGTLMIVLIGAGLSVLPFAVGFLAD